MSTSLVTNLYLVEWRGAAPPTYDIDSGLIRKSQWG